MKSPTFTVTQVREPSSKKEKEKTWAGCRTWRLVSSLIKFGYAVGMSSSYQQLNHHHTWSILDFGSTGSLTSHNSQIVYVYPHTLHITAPWSQVFVRTCPDESGLGFILTEASAYSNARRYFTESWDLILPCDCFSFDDSDDSWSHGQSLKHVLTILNMS